MAKKSLRVQIGLTPTDIVLNSTTGPTVNQWFGYSFHELSSTDIVPVVFKDGTSTGQVLWTLSFTSLGWTDGQIFPFPIEVPTGVLHVDTTGNPTGVIFV